MATTPENETDSRTHVGEQARQIVESMRVAVTGSPFVSFRLIGLLLLVAGCLAFAPFPFDVVGIIALTLVVFEVGRRK